MCLKNIRNVKKGDTLVILDNREYAFKVQEAEAILEDANAQIKVLEAAINVAETGDLWLAKTK